MSKFAAAVLVAALPVAAVAAPDTYKLDPLHTYPYFEINHFGFSNVRGRFDTSAGKFTLDKAAKTATLEITIQTASISSGHPTEHGMYPRTRDEHLRSPDFFNVAEFPTMTYKANTVKFNGDNPAIIEGSLTLLGVTKPVVLHIDNFKCGPNPIIKKDACGGNATGAIKRSDFGMKTYVPSISDEIKLWIGFEGYKE
jgi:polyisoprenoid-binding protein YceI